MIESASTRLSLLSSSASRIRSPANPFLVPTSCPRARKFTLQIFRESRKKGGALFSNFPSLKFFIFQSERTRSIVNFVRVSGRIFSSNFKALSSR